MALIEVDVDLDEFDDTDIVNEIIRRIKKKKLSDRNRAEILSALGGKTSLLPSGLSLLDTMKYEAIVPNLWRKDPQEIESFFTA